jgi:NADPH:quinone reductase-like Zn-dependent oxidoreductase
MRALVVPRFCKPDGYVVMDMPVPSLERPDDMLIKVHASGLMTGDTLVASGAGGIGKYIFKTEYVPASIVVLRALLTRLSLL